jgi:hypothetical protein
MIPVMRPVQKCIVAALVCFTLAAAPLKTRNVILITADGLRRQDLFEGLDPLLKDEKSAGMEKAAVVKAKYWRASPDERRRALMPFFWTTLAPQGVVLGNVKKKSSVRVTNGFRVSYPGYSEILTGRAQDALIHGNDAIRNPTPTVLEFLARKLGLDASQAALFGSWDLFSLIGEHQPGSIFINAGYKEVEAAHLSARLRQLSALQFEILTPWDSVRHDYVTFEMALEFMKTVRPRVLYIAFGETDDWAHDRRYDRVLEAINYFDGCLRKLWQAIEDSPEYRGRTTVVLTSDHGRGSTIDDWHSHSEKVQGADQIWAAIMGPDTPAQGERENLPEALQRDIAPTMLTLMGIDYREYAGVEGKPIALAGGGN